MNKTRIAGRIVAGAVASALLFAGALTAPAQAKDTGWGGRSVDTGQVTMLKDTGWGGV
jgi:hypothetical protein